MGKKSEVMSKHFSDLRRQAPPFGRLHCPYDSPKIGPLAGNDPRGKTVVYEYLLLRIWELGKGKLWVVT